MPPTTHLLISVVAIALMALLTWYAWRHRSVPGALAFTWLVAAITEWSIASTIALEREGLADKIFWSKMEYLAAPCLGVAWLLFTLQYTRQGKWLTRTRLILLAIVPVLTAVLAFTNEAHGLIWSRVWLDGDIRVNHGAWYWVFIGYTYFLAMGGMGVLARAIFRSPRPYRRQMTAIAIGVLAILGWSMVYLAGDNSAFPQQFTPLIVSFTGLAFAWGLFRFRLLDIVPIAREVVIENMNDGMLVMDARDRIIDLNPAAEKILGCAASACVGRQIGEIFSAWPGITFQGNEQVCSRAEIALEDGKTVRHYELRLSAISGRRDPYKGRLVIFNDITERKRAEAAERDQRTLAEALRDTAAALNSTLRLDEVLDQILTSIGRVVPADAFNLMLVEDGIARIARSQGYTARGLADTVANLRMKVADIPNLHKIITTNQPLIIPDIHAAPDWVPLSETNWVRSYAGAPIRRRGETIGILNLDSAVPNFFTADNAERLQAFVDQAAIAIENAHLYAEVQKLALTDSLTGLNNRRALLEVGRHEVERCQRLNHPLAALMIDLDLFKQVNDTYGHSMGDQLLLALVKKFQENVRKIDLIGRYGGDEFVVLLIEDDYTQACKVAERLRRAAARTKVTFESTAVGCTVSIGVATLDSTVPDLECLINRADQALYAAKQAGSNRVEGYRG